MHRILTLTWGFIIGAAACTLAAGVFVASGAIDVRALTPPGSVERTLARWTVDRSRARRAPRPSNPQAAAPDALAIGLDHYRENCVVCHGAPGVDPGEIAAGLNPDAPALERPATQRLSDGELFWTIKYGVRMTGMPAFAPTHTDDEMWAIVAFVRHLPHLTPTELTALRAATDDHSHHEGGTR